MQEVSAGGVVINGANILLLKKFSGDWVLPKGRLESGESKEEAALREVQEETGVRCEIIRRIGFVKYNYRNREGDFVQKTVHYYYMKGQEGDLRAQREEGFCEVAYLPYAKAVRVLRHDSERNMVRSAYELSRGNGE